MLTANSASEMSVSPCSFGPRLNLSEADVRFVSLPTATISASSILSIKQSLAKAELELARSRIRESANLDLRNQNLSTSLIKCPHSDCEENVADPVNETTSDLFRHPSEGETHMIA